MVIFLAARMDPILCDAALKQLLTHKPSHTPFLQAPTASDSRADVHTREAYCVHEGNPTRWYPITSNRRIAGAVLERGSNALLNGMQAPTQRFKVAVLGAHSHPISLSPFGPITLWYCARKRSQSRCAQSP